MERMPAPSPAPSTSTEAEARNLTPPPLELPSNQEIEAELWRTREQGRRHDTARNIAFALAAVFAASVLLSLFVFPIFQVYGVSMQPTLDDGDIIIADKPASYQAGDLVAFSYNNKTLTKRIIGCPGDWIDIATDGTVSVNGKTLEEPYLPANAKSRGTCDIVFPYQVPEGKYFVMGDARSVSIDSRSSQVGCIPTGQIVGRLQFRIWPINRMGLLGG
ncbi:MAG: signal peptidase I [Eggerthellaceae bacterium]